MKYIPLDLFFSFIVSCFKTCRSSLQLIWTDTLQDYSVAPVWAICIGLVFMYCWEHQGILTPETHSQISY